MRPETIQNWPGNPRGGIADKVDTKISYDASGQVGAWGFMVDASLNLNNQRCEELFKLSLDPDFQDPYEGAPSLQEARTWFTDYLSCVYRAVARHLSDTIPKFASKHVEFRFSVPTTWKNPAMIAETKQLIRNAGFGGESSKHTIEIALTEAEAAAVYASKQHYEEGDVFLVCDAGGGTSDVNILKVVSSGVGQTELEPLSWVEGRAIGSTLIDFRVEKLIAERLRSIRHYLPAEPEAVAFRMLRESSRFESFKCNLGDEAMDLPSLRLPVPGLAYGTNLEIAHIEDSQMIITKDELQKVFDDQIFKIVNLIDEQLATLQKTNPQETITYLILSGGLGSSPYLQMKLREHYKAAAARFSNTQHMQVLKAPKPQLAVCHGLVLDRVQQIKDDRVVYKERYCRNSYGVVVRRAYDPNIHFNEPLSVDPRDQKCWVENQIDWFMVQVSPVLCQIWASSNCGQGQKVSVQQGVKQHYSLKVQPGRENLLWNTQVVMSTLPPDLLPTSLNKSGVQRVCKVESSLPQDMKLKNRHWYNAGPQYLRAEFDMQVLIGPADLKFQTLSKDGIISRDHAAINVEWSPSSKDASQPNIAELEGNQALDAQGKVHRWSLRPR